MKKKNKNRVNSQSNMVNYSVTRGLWAVSTSLLGLMEMKPDMSMNGPRNEEVFKRLSDGISYHNDKYEQYDTGICCITRVEPLEGSCTDSSGAEAYEKRVTRFYSVVGRQAQYNGGLFKPEDHFLSDIYYNTKNKDDVIDFGEDYQNRGVDSVPEEVLFYYLNIPILWYKIKSLKNSTKYCELEMGNWGTVVKNMKVTISFGPIKWVPYPEFFKFKRFTIVITYRELSNGKVGCTLNVQDDRGFETEMSEEMPDVEVKEIKSESKTITMEDVMDRINNLPLNMEPEIPDAEDEFSK